MASNSTNQIAIYKDVSGVATVKLSPQETGVRVRAIPNPSTTVQLPASPFPNDGDSYEVIDADGSASPTNLIIVVAPAGTTIRGLAVFVISTPYASARFTFDGSADSWTVEFFNGGSFPGLSALWVDFAPGTVLAWTPADAFMSFDSTGAQSAVNLPAVAALLGGETFFARLMGTTTVTPVLLNAGGGTTIEAVGGELGPGNFGASSFLPYEAMTVGFKYDKATTQWKLFSFSRGSTSAARAQAGWFVDRLAGNNANSGATALLPVQHKREIMRRFGGTWAPDITATVTINYLAQDVDGSDPALFTPNFINGGILIHTAPLAAPSFTGTLLAVTAKNVVGKQALRSTFTTTTGAIVANMLLVNTTRGNSRALVQRNTAGVTWQLSQPLAPYVPGTLQFPAEVDTWANGDAIIGYVLPFVAIEHVGGNLSQYTAPFAPAHEVVQLAIFSNGGFSATQVDFGCYPIFADVVFQGSLTSAPSSGLPGAYGNIWGCAILGQLQVNNVQNETRVVGGFVNTSSNCNGLTLDCDAIIALGCDINAHDAQGLANGTASVFVEGTLNVHGNTLLGAGAKIGGTGVYNQQAGTTTYTDTAVASFPVNALHLNGVATGYSSLTTAGLTAIHQLALSAGNLDAAAGAAGFGGYATGGGGTFSKAGVQP